MHVRRMVDGVDRLGRANKRDKQSMDSKGLVDPEAHFHPERRALADKVVQQHERRNQMF